MAKRGGSVYRRVSWTQLLAAVLALLMHGAAGAVGSDDAIAQSIDRYVSTRAELGHFNGVLLFARGDKVIFRKGYGFADIEKRLPYSPELSQPVASITKMFTAFVALSLQAEGKLNLQDPLCKYLSPCPAAWQPIVLMHLVRHTSGIPDYEARLVIGSDAYQQFMLRPDAANRILADAMRDKLDFVPGTRFGYSNSAYVVLSHVLERVASEPLAELVHKYALKPAKMTASGMFRAGQRPKTLVTGYTHDELDWSRKLAGFPVTSGHLRRVPELPLAGATGDAGLYSNVDDLLRWSLALRDTRFISDDMRKAIFDEGLEGYGFGWFVGRAFDRSRHRHSGNLPGHLTDFVRFPDENVTLIVVSNNDRSAVSRMVRDVSAMILGKPFDMPVRGSVILLSEKQAAALTGEYVAQDGSTISIAGSAAALTASWKGRFTSKLIPLSATEFYLALADGRATFGVDASGKPATVNLRYSGEDHSATRRK